MAEVEARGITKAYRSAGGERQALAGVDLSVASGEFVCIIGPSGGGKTTLLNVIAGLEKPDAGTVRVTGAHGATPVTSYVFQEPRLLPWMSVSANLRFVLDRRAGADELAELWLARVGLAGRGGDYPRQLSIGQRQRVAVARALAVQPDVLLMDEPFSALDELTASRVREELLGLWAELRCTVLFVTHNPLEAAFLADRIAVMSAGPGRVVHEIDVRARLQRPRDADDPRLWELSRAAVAALRGEAAAGAPTSAA